VNRHVAWAAGVVVALAGIFAGAAETGGKAQLVEVRRIWDKAQHSAFTDLIRHRGRWLCTFREGSGHVPGAKGLDGTIRVIESADGKVWKSVALLKKDEVDLRDPKLSVTPDGRVMIVMGGSYYDGTRLIKRICQVSLSNEKGAAFSAPVAMKIDPKISTSTDWLWRVTWRGKTAYGVVYRRDLDKTRWEVHLVRSADGIRYDQVCELNVPGAPNESTLRFREDGTAYCLVRREGTSNHAMLGTSRPPYTEWTWKETSARIGGPELLILPDGRLLAAGRRYEGKAHTSLMWLDPATGKFDEFLTFPSSGDNSYPRLVPHEGLLWVSYYSSHEKRTSIYLAKVKLPPKNP
jgi:hypothetical protein